jgi:oligogalacturonide lyase
MVADTKNPDTGIYAFPVDASNSPELICLSESSNAGDHWDGPFPYEDGPIEVNAPQHTHPHPRFAPGNSHIVFTSDRTGTAQLYEVQLGDGKAS